VRFQSISSPFSAQLRCSYAKTLLALNSDPAGYAGYLQGEGAATCRLVKYLFLNCHPVSSAEENQSADWELKTQQDHQLWFFKKMVKSRKL